MEIKPPKIVWYWRFLLAMIISLTLLGMIWIFSKFREPPQIHFFFTLLLVLMAYATLEVVRFTQLKMNTVKAFYNKALRYTFSFLGSILIGTITYTILFYFFKWLDFYANKSEPPMLGHMISAMLVGIIMATIFALIQFAVNWKNQYYITHFQNEQFKKEIAQANLSILKNQLDPHFMFNNFNTLYYLIDEDSELAQAFLKNVATVYRYILQNNERALIPVDEEYQMAKQYLEVIQQRYSNYLTVNDAIRPHNLKDKSVPPLVLQQLIENAIKHNRIDEAFPLNIDFSADENRLTVRNNSNPKRPGETAKTGLKNIEKRYHFLTDQKVVIIENKEEFSVSIPLITIKDAD
ncbi:hypothetical protein GTQ40_08965 [Flavobacteriaceae bacterium R38]|nr:hypothetical protein [Flavobacteriaceae bacterium R38]